MNKVPKLRFKEFSGEWEEKKFKDVTNGFEYGMNVAAKEFDGKNKYIRITDIDERNNTYSNLNIVSPDGELEKKYLVEEDDILFARTGASTGKTYLYNNKDGILYFAGFLIRAKINNKNDSKFIFLQTLTEKYKKWVKITSMRSGQPGINSQEYGSYSFNIPVLQEQQKIANFFSLIDKKIEKQQEKVEALKDYKKGMMQKIFSQEIRFKGNNGEEYPEWEEKKLGDILTIPEKIKEENICKDKLLTVKLHRMGVQVNKNTDTLDIGSTVYYKRNAGELIYGKQNFFNGAIAIIPIELDGFLSSGDVPSLSANRYKVDLDFLLNFIGRSEFYRKTEALASGTGSKRLHENILLNIEIYLPTLQEQQKIANFLSILDKKLKKEQEKLDSLNKWKKGLLQQMFV